jgi:hypothetical protein
MGNVTGINSRLLEIVQSASGKKFLENPHSSE